MVGLREDEVDDEAEEESNVKKMRENVMKIEIGDRIDVEGDRGTVKFVGQLDNRIDGIWLGIDWDDPKRGKHSGVYNGIQYFKPRYETSGSFVKLDKVSLGVSIVEAIKDKYGGDNKILDTETVNDIEKALNAPYLKMVGFDKVVQLQSYESLKIVGLREERVKCDGGQGELANLCPLIEELDLSRNLINNWKIVAQITSQLPHLSFLDLSENRLSYDEETEKLKSGFSNLEFLVLSRLEYTWTDIMHCSKMWPQINKLQVSYNVITSLTPSPENILSNLTLLSIEGNSIIYWSEIMKLGHLQRLEVLNASYTGIQEICLPTPNYLFPVLRYLLLSGNSISCWTSINELNKLKCLNELKLRDNPILNGITRETARQITIARVPSLQILNGQEIKSDERRGAEYDYLKQNAKMWHQSKELTDNDHNMEVFIRLHPRYLDLVKKYGEIDESEFELKSTALNKKLVMVEIRCADKTVKKRLPLTMTIQKLTNVLFKIFNKDVLPSQLSLISDKNPDLKVPLNDEMKQLDFYSVEQGDIILIDF